MKKSGKAEVRKYEAFIFDMDGVLIDNMRVHTQAWLELFGDLGAKMDAQEFLSKTSGMKAADVLKHFLGTRLKTKDIPVYVAQKEFLYRVLIRKQMKPAAGVLKFLAETKRLKLRIGLATGGGQRNIDFLLGGFKIKPYFSAVVGAGDVKRGKPHPEPYLKAARLLGVSPQTCLVFEDALPGVEAARRAGMQTVALTTSHRAAEFNAFPNVIRTAPNFVSLNPAQLINP